METMKKMLRGSIVAGAVGLCLLASPGLAQGIDEDHGAEGAGQEPTVITPTGGLSCDNTVMDFDQLTSGATSVGAIQTAFPGSTLANLVFTTRAGTGTYDFQTGGGQALAANSDGSGALAIVPIGGAFGNSDVLTVTFSEQVYEFGFEVGDWSGPFNVAVSDGGNPAGSLQISTIGSSGPFFIASDVPFDSLTLTALPDNPAANWVVPSIHVCNITYVPPVTQEIPTLGTIGLAALALLLIGASALLIRRRRTA